MLVRGGVVYFGKVGSAAPYFENLGFTMAPRENPADFLIALVQAPDGVDFLASWREALSRPGHQLITR